MSLCPLRSLICLHVTVFLAVAAPKTHASPYSEAVLGDGPVSYWRFDDPSGDTGATAVDSAGGGNDGVYKAGTPSVPESIQLLPSPFSGVGGTYMHLLYRSEDWPLRNLVIVQDALNLRITNAITLEGWVTSTNTTGGWYPRVLDKSWDRGYALLATPDGRAGMYLGGFGVESAQVIADGQWHHLVGTWDSAAPDFANMKLYIDGVLQAQANFPGPIPVTNVTLQISAQGDHDPEFFAWKGDLDEVAVYSHALTPEQIQAHYAAALVVPGLPGDYNADGSVDAADYVVWRKNDGNQDEYDTWRANFGSTAGSGSRSLLGDGVPEPTTRLLVVVTAFTLASASGSKMRMALRFSTAKRGGF